MDISNHGKHALTLTERLLTRAAVLLPLLLLIAAPAPALQDQLTTSAVVERVRRAIGYAALAALPRGQFAQGDALSRFTDRPVAPPAHLNRPRS